MRRIRSFVVLMALVLGVGVSAPGTAQDEPTCYEKCSAEEELCREACNENEDPVACAEACGAAAEACDDACALEDEQ